ncbi:MAG: phenylacetic acid degradation operon negative regulatory protein [Gammaproteobacteria bacterium]
MGKLKLIDQFLTEYSRSKPVRAGSLIISLFGDSISQHGNSVWLGSLIESLAPFGLNARQIRTAVFRLVQEDWLVSQQSGRRSYYSFTEFGVRHYEKAARRIYMSQLEDWDGKWTVVIPAFVSNENRDELRKELLWLGYGTIAPGILAHPSGVRQSLDETLQEMGITDKVVVLKAETEELTSRACLKTLTHASWKLDEIALRYEQFLQKFRSLSTAIMKTNKLEPQECFLIRTLLIHEYRRILLNDADLPAELLPVNWPGKTAFEVTASLYKAVHQGAIDYIKVNMKSMDGPLPSASKKYYSRFGGLEI